MLTLARIGLALSALAAMAACGAPPEVAHGTSVPPPGPSIPALASPSPSRPVAPPTALPSAPATSPTGFPESYAVDCAGRPTGAQVIRALRRDSNLLPGRARVTVETGPVCAGTWQYTVVTMPGREPLAVVTRGAPGALRLVTAGTNVCSAPVRAQAPPGIRATADCL